CQNRNPSLINFDYIYRISHRNAKKGKPGEMDLPYWKLQMFNQGQDVISQVFEEDDIFTRKMLSQVLKGVLGRIYVNWSIHPWTVQIFGI
ncbi:MAG: hypothetical protein WBI57_02955, partial [Desulfobacterales bacterium]